MFSDVSLNIYVIIYGTLANCHIEKNTLADKTALFGLNSDYASCGNAYIPDLGGCRILSFSQDLFFTTSPFRINSMVALQLE